MVVNMEPEKEKTMEGKPEGNAAALLSSPFP